MKFGYLGTVSVCLAVACGSVRDGQRATGDGADLDASPRTEAGQPPIDGAAATPIALVSNLTSPSLLAVDTTDRVVFTNEAKAGDTADVLSVPKLGGPVTTVAAQVARPTWLAAYGGVVYWTGKDGFFMVAAGGGTPHLISTNVQWYGMVAVDATGLVWTTDDHMTMRADLNGSSATTLAPGAPAATAIAIDKGNAFLLTGLMVFSAPREGGAFAAIALGCAYAAQLAIDDGAVYYGCRDDFTIRRMPRAGGTPTTLVSHGNASGFVGGIAVDATSLFFTNNGSVLKASKTNPGTPSVLASDQPVATAIGVDEASVFWISHGDEGRLGAVMRLPK